jgi:hypothetical protein
MKKMSLLVLLLLVVSLMSGCIMRPYDTPEFVEVKPNQTAFVIPLEGKTSDQGQFESVEFLKKNQVATKRIQIAHKWVQKGRWHTNGEWVDTVRVIVVDRFPETREWKTVENSQGQGFVGESKDSIKFAVGISATGQITEEDTATFLYQYAGKKLSQVMDSEVRNKIGTVLLEKYGTMDIAQIRTSKQKVIQHVKDEVEPYFKKVGITISNIGYLGDLKYVQQEIQDSINADFIKQQEQKAQATANKTALDKAENDVQIAEQDRLSMVKRKEVLREMIELQKLEIEKLKWEKWDGKLPNTVLSDESSVILGK